MNLQVHNVVMAKRYVQAFCFEGREKKCKTAVAFLCNLLDIGISYRYSFYARLFSNDDFIGKGNNISKSDLKSAYQACFNCYGAVVYHNVNMKTFKRNIELGAKLLKVSEYTNFLCS